MGLETIRTKERLVQKWLRQRVKVLVALSGGVDSCLVAYLARQTLGKNNAISVVGVSPSLKQRDLQIARDFCQVHDIELVEINPGEINNPDYKSNPINRCFFCKSELYTEMAVLLKGQYVGYTIVNGNNYTDKSDYRPGMKAADKYRALSPLADCGFTKEDIRELSNHYGLSVWDKPASPCLSSRFPYGEEISIEKLKMVENAEEIIFGHGFSDVRVRYDKGTARIEVPQNEVADLTEKQEDIKSEILKFGFEKCEIDMEGLVSGKLNRVLKQ